MRQYVYFFFGHYSVVDYVYLQRITFSYLKANEGCSNFQALNKKGGNKRHLEQTGVFVCTCVHGYPLVAMDMTTPGET